MVLTQIPQHKRVAPCDIHFQSFCRMRHSQLYQDMGWLLIVSTKYVHSEKTFIGIFLAQYKLKPVYSSERERESHLEKIFPIAKCRRPRRHSALCKRLWKYSQVPSTSRANAPAKCHVKITSQLKIKSSHIKTIACTHNTYISSYNVVGVMFNVSCEAKVTDLHLSAMCHQNISGCQVPMDTL